MIAYKGFHEDLTCTKGKGVFQYQEGETVVEDRSRCGRTGAHCTEYPLECFHWYPPDGRNRYFEVEAAGNLDECGEDAKIACTRITLLKELSVFQIAAKGMMYMAEHPFRPWEISGLGFAAKRDSAQADRPGEIAIARGTDPKVKGVKDSILGLLKEDGNGRILDAKAFVVKGTVRPEVWYTIKDRKLKEAAE